MIIHCYQCFKGMNLKRRNFPGQKFKEVITNGIKVVTTMGYYCKTCSKEKG